MNSTLPLGLDHAGCVVNAFDAGAAQWERLGFALTPESRQRGAVPGQAGFHPWATANRCVILNHTYLELIGIVDKTAFNPWARFIARREGLHILALRCDDAVSAHAALAARTDALLPPVPRERTLDVDGEPRTMRFRNIFSRDELWSEARYLVIEHQTPEFLWQPRYQQHENGACDLVAITLVADEPAQLLPRLTAFDGNVFEHDKTAISARLPGHGSVSILSSELFSGLYGVKADTGMQAITVSFRNLERTLALLKQRGISAGDSPYGRWLGPRDTNGFVMHLIQDDTRS
jgi:hypothetical protein